MEKLDITGRRFGFLTAIKPTRKNKSGNAYWLVRCDCGEQEERLLNGLRSAEKKGTRSKCRSCRSRNSFSISENCVEIDVSTRKIPDAVCKVDKDDVDLLISGKCRWHAHVGNTGLVYVEGRWNGKLVLIHRIIMDAPCGMQVDHIDGDTLNNCKSNLRLVSNSDNRKNMAIDRRSKTGVVGVNPCGDRFRVTINSRWIGEYTSFDEAVAVRKRLEKEYGYHPNHGRTR